MPKWKPSRLPDCNTLDFVERDLIGRAIVKAS